jgi:hypothetical protein
LWWLFSGAPVGLITITSWNDMQHAAQANIQPNITTHT